MTQHNTFIAIDSDINTHHNTSTPATSQARGVQPDGTRFSTTSTQHTRHPLCPAAAAQHTPAWYMHAWSASQHSCMIPRSSWGKINHSSSWCSSSINNRATRTSTPYTHTTGHQHTPTGLAAALQQLAVHKTRNSTGSDKGSSGQHIAASQLARQPAFKPASERQLHGLLRTRPKTLFVAVMGQWQKHALGPISPAG